MAISRPKVLKAVDWLWGYAPDLVRDLDEKAAGRDRVKACEYMESLGIDPNTIAPTVAVIEWNGQPELHYDRELLDDDGNPRIDPLDERELIFRREILPVERDSWPTLEGEYL